jgi:bifunctional DNase/RNase
MSKSGGDMIEVKVSGLGFDKTTRTPVVLLKELEGDRVLPIWIGPSEADAISRAIEGIKPERPLTHDLMKSIIDGLKAKVTKIVITELKENTFFAKIHLENAKIDGKEKNLTNIDARPSDSIALALRVEVPIFVSEEIFLSSGTSMEIDEETKAEALKKYLENLKPEDFGKYKI